MTTPSGRRKRGNPTDRTPPGDSKKSKEAEVCLICEVIICDGDDPDDAVYCEGDCQGWLHRKCVNMTMKLYVAIGQSNDPYFCPHCKFDVYQKEINSLKVTVQALQDELAHLKSNEEATDLSASVERVPVERVPVASHPVSHQSSINVVAKSDTKSSAGILPADRKFNIVLFGIKENPPETSRSDRIKSDMKCCLDVIVKLNSEISSQSIRDCLRLGKYKQSASRPRPLLLKLNRSLDVTTILSNRDKAPQGIAIKPDLTLQERQRNSLLLGERWKLMQAGTDKKNIKIRSSIIYLNGNKHAQALNNCLQYYDSTSQSAPIITSSSAPDRRSSPLIPNIINNPAMETEVPSVNSNSATTESVGTSS